jgi:hypothetical protein
MSNISAERVIGADDNVKRLEQWRCMVNSYPDGSSEQRAAIASILDETFIPGFVEFDPDDAFVAGRAEDLRRKIENALDQIHAEEEARYAHQEDAQCGETEMTEASVAL